jgi:hypothetical protein
VIKQEAIKQDEKSCQEKGSPAQSIAFSQKNLQRHSAVAVVPIRNIDYLSCISQCLDCSALLESTARLAEMPTCLLPVYLWHTNIPSIYGFMHSCLMWAME